MRILAVLLFGLLSLSAFSQQTITCEVSPTALKDTVQPTTKFYVRGTGFLLAKSEANAVVGGAYEFGKYLAIKVQLFNETDNYVTIHPEQICVQDLVALRPLPIIPASEVSRKIRHVSLWRAFAQGVGQAGEMQAQEGSKTVESDSTGDFSYRSFDGASGTGDFKAHTTSTVDTCDTGCQARKQAIAEKYMRATAAREQQAATIESTALLAHTMAPHSEISGNVYVAMPKKDVLRNLNGSNKKTYLVNVVVPLGIERFRFTFPVDAPNP